MQIKLNQVYRNHVHSVFQVYSMNLETDKVELKVLEAERNTKQIGKIIPYNLSGMENWELLKDYKLKKYRDSKNQYFLKIAQLVSTRATCPRRSVGCVIVNKFDHIKSTGYNGVPRNYPHCIDKPCGGENSASGQGLNSCMATHAEQNALLQCDNVMEIEKIYITTSPCITCAKLIGNTSCKQVIYSEEYSDKSGIEMLNKLGIETIFEEIK